ncbi:type II toxin-antitoxin system ParD family antitoxin [Phormidesmis sp. 146-35]
MDISLTPETEQFIQQQIAIGKFSSISEVVDAGVKLLEERERIYKGRFEELQREIQIGLDASERGEVIDGETFMNQLREKLQQKIQQQAQSIEE